MRKKPPQPQSSTRLPSLGKNRNGVHTENSKESSKAEVLRIRTSIDRQELIMDGVNNAIHEYLLKKNFKKTVEAFQNELLYPDQKKPFAQDFASQLLSVKLEITVGI